MVNVEKPGTGAGIIKKRKSIFKNKMFWIFGTIGVIVLIAAIQLGGASKSKAKVFSISEAAKKDIVQSISVSGNMEANQEDRTALSPTQKVTEVMVKEGQDVKKGDTLVKFDTEDTDYQLKRAVLNYNSTKDNYENGRSAASDSVVEAESSLQKLQGSYDQVKRKFDADQVLYNGGYISKDEYETSKNSFNDAANQLKLAQSKLNSAKKALADYDKSSQSKQQMDLYKVDIDNLNKKLTESTVTAKVDGKVMKMDAVSGQYPTNDKNTILICDVSAYKMVVGLSQYDSIRVKPGQKATIKIKGLDAKYTGTVLKVGDIASTVIDGTNKESKVNVEIKIENPDKAIKVGYEADADIILNEKNGAVGVNFEAVKQDSKGKYIFVVEKDKAVKRYIKTGLETDFDIEVTDGLKEGEKYISTPNDTLKEGDAVITSVGSKK